MEDDPDTNEPFYEKVHEKSLHLSIDLSVFTHTHTHTHREHAYLAIDLFIHLHKYVIGRRGGGGEPPRDQQTAL